MVIFFTEEDLVSFGEYLLSEERQNAIYEASASEEEEDFMLMHINGSDLTNWAKRAGAQSVEE
ncbi:MAG: hypothetical protein ACOH2V_00985 [Candidatus Saccharimonadaceae bacterium]